MIDYLSLIYAVFISSVVQITIYFFIKFLISKGINSNYFAEQKIHEGEVPRVGGLLFLLSFLYTQQDFFVIFKQKYKSINFMK